MLSHLAILMKPQLLPLWAPPSVSSYGGCSCGGFCVFPEWVIQERTCTQDKVQSLFFRSYTSSLLYLLSLTGQPCDSSREKYTGVALSGDVIHLGSSWRLATIPINPPCQPFYIWSQLCYYEWIIWLVYTSCVLLLLLLSRFSCVPLCAIP